MSMDGWQDAEGTVTSVTTVDGRSGPICTVSFNYKVADDWYSGTFTGNVEYKVDDTVYLRYDPRDPETNDLVKKEQQQLHLAWIVIGAVVLALLALWIVSLMRH